MTMPGDTDPTLGTVDAHGSDRGTDGALDTKASKVYEVRLRSRKGSFKDVWWRHALAIIALVWALFPVLYILSAALNPVGTLNATSPQIGRASCRERV